MVAVDPQADEEYTTLSTFSAALVKVQIERKNFDSGNTLLTSISSALHVRQNLAIARQGFTLADKPIQRYTTR